MRSTHLAYTIVHGYDSLGRTVSVKQPHHAMAAITEYEPNKNRVATTTDADGNPTSYEYGTSGAKKGKVTTITAPDTSTTTIDYDLLNRRTFVSGTGTSPVAYDYNAYGELWKMKTWRSGTPPTGGDVTTWDYQPSTGDRLGRPDTTTQVGGHSWAYTYDATTLRPDTETITYNTGAGILTRVIDRSFDSLLRPKGWQLKNGATIEYDFSRTYESAASRPESFTGSGPFFSGEGPSFTYSYVPAAPRLVQGFASGSTVGTLNAWEPNRDVLDYKQNTFGGSIISKYDYTVNDMSHRSAVAETGSAYAGSPSVGWGYNSRGEVTLHEHTTAAYDSVYEFDTIGNRTKAAGGTTLPGSPNHASNNLNQYTTIGGVSPGYDDDGNLTSDAGGNTHGSARTYQWNAENQLRQVSSGAVADYRYDPHGRRISKTAGGVTTWFLYDGWNLVAEYQSGALTRTHLWGLDLSGTTQGAGGVGGLLCTSIGGTKYYPLYDGNGNICQYLDGSGGTASHYEYGPFGHLLNSPGTGSAPALFNFRFSTKFNDFETDFYYYGYGYYSSWMARWVNRDPIGERGGPNLYAIQYNDLVNEVDVLGRTILERIEDSFTISKSRDGNFTGVFPKVNFKVSSPDGGNSWCISTDKVSWGIKVNVLPIANRSNSYQYNEIKNKLNQSHYDQYWGGEAVNLEGVIVHEMVHLGQLRSIEGDIDRELERAFRERCGCDKAAMEGMAKFGNNKYNGSTAFSNSSFGKAFPGKAGMLPGEFEANQAEMNYYRGLLPNLR